ncbi:MIY4B hydrolase, partial [Polypterus senegalus]
MEQEIGSSTQGLNNMELEEIANKITDLDKWRDIFSSRGFELTDINNQKHQESRKGDEDSEEGVGGPQPSVNKSRGQASFYNVPYAIPKYLVAPSNLGGVPITMGMAVELRNILFGSTFHIFNFEWKKSHFKFREPYSELSYALETERGGSRAIQMVVQANIIKYLLFTRNNVMENTNLQRLCEISQKDQEKSLASALTDILWAAGECQQAIICLVTNDSYFSPNKDYKTDNFTERALLNLMMTGKASPNVFNGNLLYDDQGNQLPHPLHGVLTRCDVGYLHWNRDQLEQDRLPRVGSMLKTPKLPIWLCNINGTYSVLFSSNRSLLSDWKMEHLFELYFYNGQPSQKKTVVLTIDTHSHHWEEGHHEGEGDIEKRFPSVEMTIRTKWEGAAIDWNGTVPFF